MPSPTDAISATDGFLDKLITYIFNPVYQIMVVAAFLYFLFGVMALLWQMNNPEKREQSRRHLLYGTIGLFIILSVGAIIKFFNGILDGGLIYD